MCHGQGSGFYGEWDLIPFNEYGYLAPLPQHHVSLNKHPATLLHPLLNDLLRIHEYCDVACLFVCLFVFLLAVCSWFMISSSIEEYANGGGHVSFISKRIALMIFIAKTGRVSSKRKNNSTRDRNSQHLNPTTDAKIKQNKIRSWFLKRKWAAYTNSHHFSQP